MGEVSNKVIKKNLKNEYTETLTNSAEHGIINQRDFFDKDISNEKNLNSYYIVENEDFVYNPRISNFAPVGPIKRNKLGRTGVMSPLYYVFKTCNVDNDYLEFYFSGVMWHKFMKQNGDSGARSDRFAIKDSVFQQMPIPIPNLEEQEKIGKFFRQLDDIITLHKRKLEGLKELKKGYLQQMFPQESESFPKIRFAGFTEPWNERKLGEIFTERNERSSTGELISVTINSGVIKASSLERKDNSSEDKSNYKKVEIGDIAYNSMRMWQGASGASNYSGILSPAYTVIIPNDGIISLFFAYMFKQVKMIQIFQANSQGLTSDTWNLKFPLLQKISIMTPCTDEQRTIGNFFQSFDEQILEQQNKLNKLRQLKHAYLQKMFV